MPRESTVSPLARVRVVLSHTSHPGNIGAAARALKAMGLSQLVLVNPKHFPDAQASAMAAGADDVLAGARVVASLSEALSGTALAVAMTARRRELAVPALWAREAAAELIAALAAEQGGGAQSDAATAAVVDGAADGSANGAADGARGEVSPEVLPAALPAALPDVAVVFGNETAGLSNDELAQCARWAMIPVNPEFSSLNVAAAVQVMCYELRLAALDPGRPPAISGAGKPAGHDEFEHFIAHLERAAITSGFLDPAVPKRFNPRMRRLFARAAVEKEEVAILRGLIAALEKAAKT